MALAQLPRGAEALRPGLTLGACVAVGWVLIAGALLSPVLLILGAGALVLGLMIVTQGIERTATGIIWLATLFSPLNHIRPTANASFVTAADLLFVLGFCVMLPVMVHRRLSVPPFFAFGALIMFITGVIASVASPDPAVSLNHMLRFVLAGVGLPVAFIWWRPRLRTVVSLAGAYILSCVISVLNAVASGPEPLSGRYVGLTTHFNFLGLSTMLGAALVPFVASHVRPWLRWTTYAAGMICLYGVWISGSRAALLVIVVLAVVYPMVERSVGALWLLALAGTLSLTFASRLSSNGSSALGRLLGGSGADYADLERKTALIEAIKQFHAHPIMGNGFANALQAHNIYVEIVVAIGVIGLVGYLMIFVAMVAPLVTAPRPLNRLAYPALGYALIGLITNALWDRFIWGALTLCLLAHILREETEGTPAAEASHEVEPVKEPA